MKGKPKANSTVRSGLLRATGRAATVALAFALGAGASRADDTEIFRAEVDSSGTRPKVLIVFDDSGSMSTIVDVAKPAYDPDVTYPQQGDIQSGRIYWASGTSGNPPADDTDQYFTASANRCASSYGPLDSQGYFIDQMARWSTNSGSSSNRDWRTFSTSVKNPVHVDCNDDIDGSNPDNGSGSGAPGNGYPQPRASNTTPPYSSTRNTSIDNGWTTYRLYTANYLNWYYNDDLGDMSRIEIAQNVITSIIDANPGIDFGLAVFNRNYNTSGPLTGSSSYDGARIVRRIIEDSTDSQRDGLVSIVDDLEAEGSTPLCESVYEAYRYLAGSTVLYGLERYSGDTPARDTSAESGGSYVSPVDICQNVYIILMTDGEPQADTDANSRVETLTGKTCSNYRNANGNQEKNCLPRITEYMYGTDLDGDGSNGIQRGITYTIGFTTNQTLLSDAARLGGGLYYTADDTETLTAAFQGAITAILSTSSSFTSPSVAVDSFTRTESRNEVFFAMFEPTNGTDWPGNIKKLSIAISGGTATLQDADGNAAIDESTGQIADSARTVWSASDDGPEVDQGGAGELLAARDPSTRTIYTNTGTAGALEAFNATNITYDAFGLADAAALHSLFGVASQTALADLLAWARGWEDGSAATTNRTWILGDILHSRPLPLNYGAINGHTQAEPDLRLAVGTNAGFLHLFDNTDGGEDWAFFPKELAPVLKQRRDDLGGGDNVYGVDAPPVAYRYDRNNDGNIDASDGDKMWLYFGLRRGGKAYYALDVSDPDSPSLLWKIDKATAGFGELGQSWSVPVITTVPGYSSSGVPKPVLVFGGGYDATNDDHATTAAGSTDGEGRGIFIVDAETGAKVWSVTPAATGASNKQAALAHAIPASVTTLDSNGDGLTDRIYATDVGGNVWRVDMPGKNRPTSTATQNRWHITKLAQLAGADHAGDRRFFNAVDVVRTGEGGAAFDAVLVGSGDRTNPNAQDNLDRFYMLRDKRTTPYATAPPTSPSDTACTRARPDFRCVLPIEESDLYDATDNLVQDGSAAQAAAAQAALAAGAGWYIDLEAGTGEKALARSLTIGGKVYLTTYSPSTEDTGSDCVPSGGTGRLYVLNLVDASAATDFTGDDQLVRADRIALLGSLIPDTPSPHFGSDKEIRLLFPSGGSIRGMPNPLETGARLPQPYPVYWYDQEL